MKQKVNLLITTIAAAMLALTLASCAPIMENTNSGNDASVTITLPKLGGSSSIRALSEEQVSRLQRETVKFRITFKNNGMTTTRETTGGAVTAIFEIGSEVKITVECLNAKQQVIVRSIEKTITMKSGANSLSFKLSEDGEEIIPENGDDEGEDAPDDPVTEKFAVTYELDGGEWNPISAPPQPTEYAADDTVTITANTPTKQGLVFGGWKPSVESLSPAGENFYKKDTFAMPSEAVTLTAQWGTVARTVLYNDGLLVLNELDVNARSVGVTAEYAAMLDDGSNYVFALSADIPWHGKRSEITSVKIGSPMTPARTSRWFIDLTKCTAIDYLSRLDTSNATSMYYMFASCNSLTKLDVSNFDTSNVTNMYYMFSDCNSLTELDVSHFDTSNVTNMSHMFNNCPSLTELDVSSFDTAKVTSMYYMFASCNSLTELDVSSFDTSNVTDMTGMFASCKSLTELDVSGFDTSNVKDMPLMFNNCPSLTELDVSHFDTSNVKDIHSMFKNSSSLTELNLNSFDTANVTNMAEMFSGCTNLATIYASNTFVTYKVTSDSNKKDMFKDCTALRGGSGTAFDANNPTDTTYARIDNPPDEPGYFTQKP